MLATLLSKSQPLSQDYLEIRGARVHNLQNIDLKLPHDKLIVITGVSGSGKSSLVFDTIYAEGQRRYVESLSAYARQFLERMEKPDVEHMTGIAPAVAIRQKNTTRNPRSTVATATEIHDFLRLLFARVGETICSKCGGCVSKDNVDDVARRILDLPERSRWYVLFPVHGTGTKGLTEPLKAKLADLRGKGFNRLYQNGRVFEFSTPESLLDVDFKKPLYALVDRLAITRDLRQRVVDAIEIGYRESQEVVFEQATEVPPERLWFSERFECRQCNIEYPEPEPRLFSFNSPAGACPQCQGFGNTIDYDKDRVVPDQFKTLRQGAVDPWMKPRYRRYQQELLRSAKEAGVRLNVPYHELSVEEVNFVIHGGNGFKGVDGFFAYLERKKYKMHVRIFLARYRGYTLCPSCKGGRLREEALNVRVGAKTIRDVSALSLDRAKQFFDSLTLSNEKAAIAEQLLVDIRHRLTFLNDVGLEYLTLDRMASTLSGGEAQRIQLATSLGSRLVGACYVLDEPSIGLHSRDTGRLIKTLKHMRDLGNTILVVEHDAEVMRSSDHIVDLGPGAGEQGGKVIFEGPYQEIVSNGGRSLTGFYLRGDFAIGVPQKRRKPKPRRRLKFDGAMVHNLKNIDVAIPLDVMTVISGVSGSGKSTLVHDVVYQGLQALRKHKAATSSDKEILRLPCRRVAGASFVDEVVLVDQSPIGRSPRSNPITYVKAFDAVRELFASTNDAQRRGLTPGNFSFNIPGGRCETCQGGGTVTVEMQFLADVELVCEDCNGKRYKSDVLDVRCQGKNIYEVLQLTVEEALQFFVRVPKIVNKLACLAEVGLGYLRLGQSATTLSGGEAQRVKLAGHVAQSKCEGTLYLFDEPTTGLHFDDIAKLLAAFRKLLDNGGTVLVIEHNLDVIKNADWLIDLGPEGGELGGEIVAQGTPEQIASCKKSYTGRYLSKML